MELFGNNLRTTLAAPATSGALSLTVADATGWPSPTGGDFFRVTLIEVNGAGVEIDWEVCACTARAGNILTVTRGVEGAARAWAVGTRVTVRPTADWAGGVTAGVVAALSVLDTTGATTGHVLTVGTPGAAPAFSPPPSGTVPDPSAEADGRILQVASGALVYADPPAPGGGGGLVYPDSAPASPSAFDDEFTGGSLAGIWTQVNDPTATGFTKTFAKHGTWLALPNPGAAANNLWLLRQALSGLAAGTAFSVTMRMALRIWGTTLSRVTVGIGNNSTFVSGSYLLMDLIQSGGALQFNLYDGSSLVTDTLSGAALYVHFQRSASNVVRVWTSLDGFGWRMRNTATRNWDAAFCFVRLLGNENTGQPSEPMIDWIRFNDARFTMPVP